MRNALARAGSWWPSLSPLLEYPPSLPRGRSRDAPRGGENQSVAGAMPGRGRRHVPARLLRLRRRPRRHPHRRALAGLWQVAIVWAVAIMLAIYIVGGVSGAHINPAITLALAVWGRFSGAASCPLRPRLSWPAPFAAAAVLFMPLRPVPGREGAAKAGRPRASRAARSRPCATANTSPTRAAWPAATEAYSREDHDRLNALVSEPAGLRGRSPGDADAGPGRLRRDRRAQRGRPAGRLAPVFIGLTVAVLIAVIAPADAGLFQPGPRFWAACLRRPRRLGEDRPAGAARAFSPFTSLSPVLGALARRRPLRRLVLPGPAAARTPTEERTTMMHSRP